MMLRIIGGDDDWPSKLAVRDQSADTQHGDNNERPAEQPTARRAAWAFEFSELTTHRLEAVVGVVVAGRVSLDAV